MTADLATLAVCCAALAVILCTRFGRNLDPGIPGVTVRHRDAEPADLLRLEDPAGYGTAAP